IQKSKTTGVSTRSRAALGDIKNKTSDIVAKDVSKQKTEKFRHRRGVIRSDCLASPFAEEFLEVDEIDFSDAATVYPYGESIFDYLQDRELSVQPLATGFMVPNAEVTPRMRYILVNWLVQVHYSYKLQPETLYLTVAIMDRYLLVGCKFSQTLTRDELQLIGIAALFIAAKFEEMYPPEITDFSSITNNAFTKNDIRNAEQMILQSIDFYLSIPTPLAFLRRLSKSLDVMHNLAKYFLELTIQEYELSHLPGNYRAAVAFCLSRALTSGTGCLQTKLPFKIQGKCIITKLPYSQAIFSKYRNDDFYGRVASMPELRSSLMESLANLRFDSDGEVNRA
ncbi:unnamed protein product, partial [Trichobilharzia regenti]